MKNPFSLKCFDISEAIQEGINEIGLMAGYKQSEVKKLPSPPKKKNRYALLVAITNFLKL